MAKISINLTQGSLIKDTPIAANQNLIVGIDLGTTNSLVAYMLNGQPVCVAESNGKNTLVPSVLHFLPEGGVLVGNAAKEKLLTDASRTVFSVKRLMGKSYKDIQNYEQFFSYKIIDDGADDSLVKVRIDDQFYTPIELSSKILEELKNRIEERLKQPVTRAVITVPAYFNDSQRQATRDAGKLAGLDVLRIVNEPTAAALAYGIGIKGDDNRVIAVYDLGGGTFDVSILRIENGVFEVLATNGDTFLGGDDFDRAIVEYWLALYPELNAAYKTTAQLNPILRLAAEEAKKQLSSQNEFEKVLFIDSNTSFKVELSLVQFNTIITPLVEKTLACCNNALRDAGLKVKDIEDVILVGGSTRVPLVKQRLAELFSNININDSVNPDEVVALGAAVQADILAGNNKEILLLDITPLSLGIETVGGLMDVIIPRNSKVPTALARSYTTSIDGQKNLKVAVYQGERDLVSDNRKLGEFIVKGIPPMPAGIPKIEIQFMLNADGILKVKASELRSGVAQTIDMKPSYGLSEEDMGKMLLESIKNAASDMTIRALIEARTEAQSVLLAADKFLIQNHDILTEEERAETRRLAEAMLIATKGDDKDLIRKAMGDLNTYTEPLAHRAMDKNITDAMAGKKINEA